MAHNIRITIPPGWRSFRHIDTYGEMVINLDAVAERCGNSKYKYHPYTDRGTEELQVTQTDFRKMCNLIVKYARDADYETAEKVFSTSTNLRVRRIWNDAKTKFESKRSPDYFSQA